MLVIREARPSEAATICALEQLCFPANEAADGEEMLERLKLFPENFLVAEVDGILRGYIDGASSDQCRIDPSMYHDASRHVSGGDYLLVYGVAVHPNARGQGIASMLLKSYAALAKKRGQKGVALRCKDYEVRYYSRLGFRDLGPCRTGHGHDMILSTDQSGMSAA